MNNEKLNSAVRDVFQKAIGDGHKKNHVCALTLGSQCVPQFDRFLKGRDFGIKPMERVLSAFDYELRLVPVPKNDADKIAAIDSMCNDFLDNTTQILITSLENVQIKSSSGRTSPMFQEVAADIIKNDLGFELPEKE